MRGYGLHTRTGYIHHVAHGYTANKESLALEILDDHVTHCVADVLATRDPKEAETKSTELLGAVRRFARTR